MSQQPGIIVSVEGVEEVTAMLRQLESAAAERVVQAALRRAAQPIVRLASGPSAPFKTGRLVNSIGVVNLRKRAGSRAVIVATKGRGWHTGDAYYGGMVEFGHFLGARRKKRTERAFVREMFKTMSGAGGWLKRKINGKTTLVGPESGRMVNADDLANQYRRGRVPADWRAAQPERKYIEGRHFVERAGRILQSSTLKTLVTLIRDGVRKAIRKGGR